MYVFPCSVKIVSVQLIYQKVFVYRLFDQNTCIVTKSLLGLNLVSLSLLFALQTQTFKMELGPFKNKISPGLRSLKLQYGIGPKTNSVKIPYFSKNPSPF